MEKKLFTYDEIKVKLMNYCAYQDRCHDDVERKMREFVLIPEAKDEILLYLMRENFLNEERFVRSFIRGKFTMKKWGRNKISQHLKQKNITDKLIKRCYDEIDEKEYLDVIAEVYRKYFEKQKGLKEYQKKSKTIRYLLSRGFEYEEILKVIED